VEMLHDVARVAAGIGDMIDHRTPQCPGRFVKLQPGYARLMKRVDQFAVDIELQLRMRGVADPDRQRAFVTGQPARFPFQQASLAHDAVHDLHICR